MSADGRGRTPVMAPQPVAPPPHRQRVSILPPGQRERRHAGGDRRRTERRGHDQGSPYGVDRRSGSDDRQGDRRARTSRSTAGIGLTRDYFSQTAERTLSADATAAAMVERFRD